MSEGNEEEEEKYHKEDEEFDQKLPEFEIDFGNSEDPVEKISSKEFPN